MIPNNFEIEATGACLNDATGQKNDVRFSYELKFEKELKEERELNFVLSGSGFKDADGAGNYEDVRIYADGVLLENLTVDDQGHVIGEITAPVGTKKIELWADATAKGKVSGGEELTLIVQSGIFSETATASVAAEDCPE